MAVLTPEIEAKGLKAYEQTRAFERLRTWRLPLSYAFFLLLPAANGAALWRMGQFNMAAANVVALVLIGVGSWWHWERLKARYVANLQFLGELERQHGDALPWIQVEKHLAALEKLKQEIAAEQAKEGL